MKAKLIDIQTSINIEREMEKMRKIEKKRMTRDEIKQAILKMLREAYKSEDNDIKAVYQINTINTNEYDLGKNTQKKKKRNFVTKHKENESTQNLKNETTQSFKTKQTFQSKNTTSRLNIKQTIKEKLNLEYSHILSEFNMDIDHFLEYCDEVINNQKRIGDLLLEEEREMEFDENDSQEDRLFKAVTQIILKNKESSLIPKKSLLRDEIEHKLDYHVAVLIDDYLKKEQNERGDQMEEIKALNRKQIEDNDDEIQYIDYEEVLEEEESKNEGVNFKKKLIDYDKRIPWWLRVMEFLLISLFIINSHLYVNVFSQINASWFNAKILEVFNANQDCLSELLAVQSPFLMNQWIYNCYAPTMKSYYFTDLAAVEEANSKLTIPIFMIGIESFKMENCSNSGLFNATFKNPPQCFTNKYDDYYLKKKKIIDDFNFSFIRNVTHNKLEILDLLFFDNIRMDHPLMLIMKDPIQAAYFNDYIKFAKNIRCEYLDYKLSTCVQPRVPKETKINELVNYLNEAIKEDYILNDPLMNNIELVDLSTKNVNLYTYWASVDLKLWGLTIFEYKVREASVYTNYRNYVSQLHPNGGPEIGLSNTYYYIAQYILVFSMLFFWYFKSRFLNNFDELTTRSLFFMIFLFVFFFESFFDFYHMSKGSYDFVYLAPLMINEDKREISILFMNNIKIIKSISIVALCYHLIYVVFNVKDLVVFTTFLKPVYQRFFIVLFIFIAAFAIIINVYLGGYFSEYTSFISSFFNILNYVLGVNNEPNLDKTTYPHGIMKLRSYFELGNYALRLIVLNFSMIIMFYFYRKSYNYYESLNQGKMESNKNK